MSDFDSIFGAGANIESIISGINSNNRLYDKDEDEYDFFDSYEEACEWAKNNPNRKFQPCENGYFSVKKNSNNTFLLRAPIYKNNEKKGMSRFMDQIDGLIGDIDEKYLNEIVLNMYSISETKDIFVTPAHLIGLEKSLDLDEPFNHGIYPINDNLFAIYEKIDECSLRGFLKVDSLRIRLFSSPANVKVFANLIGHL